jgi:hypothetical protein
MRLTSLSLTYLPTGNGTLHTTPEQVAVLIRRPRQSFCGNPLKTP